MYNRYLSTLTKEVNYASSKPPLSLTEAKTMKREEEEKEES